tara:strand:+ start:37 stop:177 length:141 start_codon:yes stop_codon:yes gene_type:complete
MNKKKQKEFGKLVNMSLTLVIGISAAVSSFITILILLLFYLGNKVL